MSDAMQQHAARSIVDYVGLTKSARESSNQTMVELERLKANKAVAKAEIAAKHAEAMATIEAQRPGATVESIIAAAQKGREAVMKTPDEPPEESGAGEWGWKLAEAGLLGGAGWLAVRAIKAMLK